MTDDQIHRAQQRVDADECFLDQICWQDTIGIRNLFSTKLAIKRRKQVSTNEKKRLDHS